MDFLQELKWRGMIHNSMPGIEAHLSQSRTGYIGFDPTSSSLTIGNFVQIMLLRLFQLSGHRPIALMGGATGRIGDPSGRSEERQLKSYDEIDFNVSQQIKIMEKLLDFDGSRSAIMVNNYDFYKDMNVMDYLRDLGKNFTINYMMSKDSVKTRLETGLSYTEFSYQILQGYDFVRLYKDYGCTVQMGGSDQWGNITSGTEMIRRMVEKGEAYAVTTPLLTKADGSKFGKSAEGNVWLTADKTSPYKFYQFWINAADSEIPKLYRYFSLKSRAEVEGLESSLQENPNELKRILAEELTRRVHSGEDFKSVQKVSELMFNRKLDNATLRSFEEADLIAIGNEIPSFKVSSDISSLNVVDFLTEATSIFASKGEARRAISGNAVSINKIKITSPDLNMSNDDILNGGFILIENGKKNKFMAKV